jgi:hypothetical protein
LTFLNIKTQPQNRESRSKRAGDDRVSHVLSKEHILHWNFFKTTSVSSVGGHLILRVSEAQIISKGIKTFICTNPASSVPLWNQVDFLLRHNLGKTPTPDNVTCSRQSGNAA